MVEIISTPIFIATCGRACKVNMLKYLPPSSILFVEPRERDEYALHYPDLHLVSIGLNNQGLAYVRNFILQYAIDHKFKHYWMLDDDIKGFYTRQLGANKVEKALMLPTLESAEQLFLKYNLWHGSLEYQQFAWSMGDKEIILNSFCDNAVWFDVEKCKILSGKYRLKLKVDRDFCMQVIDCGGTTGRSTLHAFATPPDGSNDGGLKEMCYDVPGEEERNVDELIKLWPVGVVTKFVKDTGRIDAKINWKLLGSKQTIFNPFD